jgi:uncharacterized protein
MSNPFGISEHSLELILETFGAFPEIEEVRIFGSRALGNYKNGSDIDIALLGTKASETIARKISLILNEEMPIPYHVDVIAFEACENEELKRHISDFGKVMWSRAS